MSPTNQPTNQNSDLGFSPDAKAQRLSELTLALHQIAPELISDNRIDLARLKDLLGDESFATNEHYELSWAGKTAARREIQKTTSHTLLPASDNPTHAPHMLIEGENLEVLRVLQKSYYGKVKMIYIDPPYNTGNDSFVYPDDYSETLDEYQKRTGEKNQDGFLNKQSLWKKNSKESGQYHSAWLSMMYPRLYLARNLLRDDGVIFISIDDNEAANLKLLCDEVFGAENFVALLPWKGKGGGADNKYFMVAHEYILMYAKQKSEFDIGLLDKDSTGYNKYDATKKQHYKTQLARKWGSNSKRTDRPNLFYPIYDNNNNEVYPLLPDGSDGCWRWSKNRMQQEIELGNVEFDKNSAGKIEAYEKIYEPQDDEEDTKKFSTWLDDVGNTAKGSKELKSLLNEKFFDFPKPTDLIKRLVLIADATDNDIILDFFIGSGTTVQAVLEQNIDDGNNRQCICVQMPERTFTVNENAKEIPKEKTAGEAYKAGYRTIADITRARIDKVIDKLKTEHPDKTADLACANFVLAPSNFKVWRSDVADVDALRAQLELLQTAELTQTQMDSRFRGNDGGGGNDGVGVNDAHFVDSQTAMLSELLLKFGLGALGVHAITRPLSVAGVTIHRVLMHDDAVLWLCFEPYSASLKDAIVAAKPAQVMMLNSCFVGDKKDELLSNLQLELAGLDIGLTVIWIFLSHAVARATASPCKEIAGQARNDTTK